MYNALSVDCKADSIAVVEQDMASLTSPSLASASDSRSFFSEYDVLSVIGQGSAGVVFCVRRRSDMRTLAAKAVQSLDQQTAAIAKQEFRLLMSIEHPNIVRVHELFESPGRVVMVQELAQGVELDIAVKKDPAKCFLEPVAQGFFVQLLEALNYLHGRRILHRDVKGSNMLVCRSSGSLTLVDFNVAKQLSEGKSLTMTGTQQYAAPELLLVLESPSDQSDIWAAGLCLHLMLAGRLPWRVDHFRSQEAFVQEVSTKPVPLHGRPCWDQASDACLAVLRRCLEIVKWRRPAAMTLLHDEPWLAESPTALAAIDHHSFSRGRNSYGSSSSRCASSGNPGRATQRSLLVPFIISSVPCLGSFPRTS